MDRNALEEAVHMYFEIGFSHQEILCALAINHTVVISLRTLKRILRRERLYRRKYYSNILDILMFITKELQQSGSLHGYRWMHMKCLQSELSCDWSVNVAL